MIMQDTESGPFFMADEQHLVGIDIGDLDRGRRVDGWNSESSLNSNQSNHDANPYDVEFAGLPMIPTFSSQLQAALFNSHIGTDDVQYLPVRLVRSTGEEIHGFAMANVLTRVAALDRDRCYLLLEHEEEIDPATGLADIMSIFNIAVRSELLKGHDIARLVEFRPAVLVSQRFVDVYEQGHFTGAIFSPLIMS
jgi:Immunity protein family (Imm11)